MNRALLGLLLLTLASPLAADELRLFELQHRSAEELIPMLRPLLPPQAGISGSGNTLMVRSTAQELAQLSEVLQQLDRPRRQLLISVQQGQQGQRNQSGIEVQGKLDQPQTRLYSTRRQQL
ncbi:MAG: nodulation protein NolW, partial [Chromatiales bacterium]|nr:nodulation protein NolW [Chromatiales bacterium]